MKRLKLTILVSVFWGLNLSLAHGQSFTLCDCVNEEMDSDAMIIACSKIFQSHSRSELSKRRNACKGSRSASLNYCDCIQEKVDNYFVSNECAQQIAGLDDYEITREYLNCRR